MQHLMDGSKHDCDAITEEESGSHETVNTRATKVAGGYHINGEKWFVTSANLADFFWLQAKTDRGEDLKALHVRCSMAKLYASEMANRVVDRVEQIFGGRGYMRQHAPERFYRELRVDRIWEGSSEIQRMIIAKSLLKRGLKGM